MLSASRCTVLQHHRNPGHCQHLSQNHNKKPLPPPPQKRRGRGTQQRTAAIATKSPLGAANNSPKTTEPPNNLPTPSKTPRAAPATKAGSGAPLGANKAAATKPAGSR